MRRSRLGSAARARLAECEAEDRLVNYLATLPPSVAVAAAIKGAVQLAEAWEFEKSEMLRRGDRRRVYLGTAEQRHWLERAVRRYRGDPCWQHCPVAEVRSHLAGLPPDAAANTAYLVARYICCSKRINI